MNGDAKTPPEAVRPHGHQEPHGRAVVRRLGAGHAAARRRRGCLDRLPTAWTMPSGSSSWPASARRSSRPTEFQSGIPQALTLMNGTTVSSATDLMQSPMLQSLEAPFFTHQERVDVLFLATLSRLPLRR